MQRHRKNQKYKIFNHWSLWKFILLFMQNAKLIICTLHLRKGMRKPDLFCKTNWIHCWSHPDANIWTWLTSIWSHLSQVIRPDNLPQTTTKIPPNVHSRKIPSLWFEMTQMQLTLPQCVFSLPIADPAILYELVKHTFFVNKSCTNFNKTPPQTSVDGLPSMISHDQAN